MTDSNDEDVTFSVEYSLDDGDTWEDVEANNGENVIISSLSIFCWVNITVTSDGYATFIY